MIIITSGKGNVDIDAYGGAIAYAYLLNLKEWWQWYRFFLSPFFNVKRAGTDVPYIYFFIEYTSITVASGFSITVLS